jgi:Fur family ferric uptake transcriptional regulator
LIIFFIYAGTMIPTHVISTLRARGYKITRQRRAVLEALTQAQGHLSPQEVHEKVCHGEPSIGLATVYRTLEMLRDLGIVCELSTPGSGHTYTIGTAGHHHHLICSECKAVVDFTTQSLEDLAQRLALESGFVIQGHVLEFTGLCPDCSFDSKV